MNLWWSGLGLELQVFYAIAIATTALLVLQLALMLFGADLDGDAQADFADGPHDLGHGDAFSGVLSFRTVTAFFTGFGWAGVAALKAGWSVPMATLAALAAGAAFMVGILAVIRGLYGLQSSGTLDYRNAIGQVGTVYLAVPAAMAGPGQVEVRFQGRLSVVQAFTRAPGALPFQSRVRVVDVLDGTTLVVEPLSADLPPTER